MFERALREIKPTPDTVVRPDANGTPSVLAQAYAGLGEKEKALQQATQAVRDYQGDAVNQPPAQAVLARGTLLRTNQGVDSTRANLSSAQQYLWRH